MSTRKNLIDTLTGLFYSNTDLDWVGSRWAAVLVTDNIDECVAAVTPEDIQRATGHELADDVCRDILTTLQELQKLDLWKRWVSERVE